MRAASWNCAELPRAASAIPADVGINNSGVAKAFALPLQTGSS
jgi:hypothetical protein